LSTLPPPAEAPKAGPFAVAKPVGTWVREIDTQTRILVTFDEDRLFASATFGDGPDVVNVTLDADYSINKESVVYAVVTGIECDDPEEGLELELILTGQPFAFRFRADGDTLTVKDFKGVGYGLEGADEADEVVLLLCGRYVAADEARPAPRAPVKPAARPRKGTVTSRLILPRNRYAGDPTTRMTQLLNQSEDHRSIREKWRRYWFNDVPNHMTPERIHGGIM
jgi:hypothetical protein